MDAAIIQASIPWFIALIKAKISYGSPKIFYTITLQDAKDNASIARILEVLIEKNRSNTCGIVRVFRLKNV